MRNLRRAHVRAFTLVELLVVIGIIGVLISILLPAMARARESAKLVTCASQLRQIGIAARAYAAENKDALPPWNQDKGQVTYDIGTNPDALGHPWWTTFPSGWPGSDPETMNPSTGAQIGRLIVRKHLAGAFYKVQQCPSAYESEDPGTAYWRNYLFNPHLARRNTAADGSGGNNQPWFKKLSDMKAPKTAVRSRDLLTNTVANRSYANQVIALATDPILNFASTTEYNRKPHLVKNQYAVNVLGADGSVIAAHIPRDTVRRTDSWGRFVDFLTFIEQVAYSAGKPSGLGGGGWVPVNPK